MKLLKAEIAYQAIDFQDGRNSSCTGDGKLQLINVDFIFERSSFFTPCKTCVSLENEVAES